MLWGVVGAAVFLAVDLQLVGLAVHVNALVATRFACTELPAPLPTFLGWIGVVGLQCSSPLTPWLVDPRFT
jgi:hypothetical protein